MKKIITAILLFLNLTVYLEAENTKTNSLLPYSPEAVKLFADSLFEDGFYDEASGEYKRFLFMYDYDFTKNNTGSNNTSFSEIKSELIKQNFPVEFTDAVFKLEQIYNYNNDSNEIYFLYNNFYNTGNNELDFSLKLLNNKFLFLNKKTACNKNSGELTDNLFFLSDCILNKNFSEAKLYAAKLSEYNEDFKNLAAEINSYKIKSPVLATALSVLIPGAGKFYTGSWTQGLSSLLSVSSFTGAAVYTGIKYGKSDWRPWTYGSIAAVIYITNIYGTCQDAIKINELNYRNICSKTVNAYDSLWNTCQSNHYENK